MINLSKLLNTAAKHAPIIFTSCAGLGVASSVLMAIKETPNARYNYERYLQECDSHPTTLGVAKVICSGYAGTLLLSGATIFCIFASYKASVARLAAVNLLYSASEKMARTYRQAISNESNIVSDRIFANAAKKQLKTTDNAPLVISSNSDDCLCYDSFSGRYFNSSPETIKRQVNEFNSRINNQGDVSLNELYLELGIPECEAGNKVGFSGDIIRPIYSSVLTDKGVPCLVVGLNPKYL